MSVYTTGSLTFTTSSIETGSAYWPFYSLTANSSRYYLIKAEANLVTASVPPPPSPSPTYSGLIRCSNNDSNFYYVGSLNSGDKIDSGGICYISTGTTTNINNKSQITGTISSCNCSSGSSPSPSGSSPSPSGSSPSPEPDPGPSPAPTYTYYNMSKCDNTGNVIGRSTSSNLYNQINRTYVISGTTCATIDNIDEFNTGTFQHSLDGLTALSDCNASACQSGGSSGSPGGGSPGGIGGPPPESPPANPPSGGGGGDDELTPG